MAKVVLIEVETAAAGQICRALAADGHQVERRQQSVVTQELLDADIVFAGGEPAQYLLLLKRVREVRPTLPFVVVTRMPETSAWLNALEAGATDCCAAPIETRQLRWLVESALPAVRWNYGCQAQR
jgi:DNA-binding response OmpR family regulator